MQTPPTSAAPSAEQDQDRASGMVDLAGRVGGQVLATAFGVAARLRGCAAPVRCTRPGSAAPDRWR